MLTAMGGPGDHPGMARKAAAGPMDAGSDVVATTKITISERSSLRQAPPIAAGYGEERVGRAPQKEKREDDSTRLWLSSIPRRCAAVSVPPKNTTVGGGAATL
jgi:hypothetical protein